ncbi:ribosome-associated translation inhibitor RaiA [Carnobacteriaceae bacterium zg-ZUI252]|nr:ribosome-associated translation inhibitor RaiA [Carnobacteriaceae bacterium zg-ZUI252]MBS4770667.1 ribosome-associated translation inhibitor RaiA [Carnobacteriaceae bacterium zg-ZUI240]QTU82943.1 ribosome-associated translation inhibitor RaiA [Carnobacteriaceae bacterium zg-C25]
MLTFNIRGENIEVTQAIREYCEKKLTRLERYFTHVPSVISHVNLKVYPDKTAKVEVTIPLPFLVLRAEETSPDLYGSIDLVIDKLERQIRRYKTKIQKKSRDNGFAFENAFAPNEDVVEENDNLEIVRIKRIPFRPMDAEEAILQMNMLGHDFFAYIDMETEDMCVVYRRKDGKYGLIEADR